MADRAPIFELHIRPLFRQVDRLHMLRVKSTLDLWNYDSVKTNATVIAQRIGGSTPSMPTSDTGGFWPAEWQTLFARWVAGGFRRLTIGTGQNYKLVKSGAVYRLTCDVSIPNSPDGDAAAWFDIVDPGPAATTYQLLIFPGEAEPPATDMLDSTAEEHVDAASAVNGITVIDATGTHRITP